MTDLSGRAFAGAHRYRLSNGMDAVFMANGRWMIFDNKGSDDWDTGEQPVSFRTLHECRKWAGEVSR